MNISQAGWRNQSPKRTSKCPKITQQKNYSLDSQASEWAFLTAQVVPALLPLRVGLAPQQLKSTRISGVFLDRTE